MHLGKSLFLITRIDRSALPSKMQGDIDGLVQERSNSIANMLMKSQY